MFFSGKIVGRFILIMIFNNSVNSLFISMTLFLMGTVIFLDGFFPSTHKKVYGSFDKVQTRPETIDGFKLNIPNQKYSQIILMVIDALRSDFPTENTMPTVMESACHSLNLLVDVPTVTMPRIKSMMTGTVSNFIDIVFNVGHTQKVDDSLIHRIKKKKNGVVVFAGDDTWVKLFGTEFARYEANNDSLFVQDFFEGDKKVKSSLDKEITKTDWVFLILHYLGLDHIGHVEGTASLKIPSKLKEMDSQVESIIKKDSFKDRLLILTSDHGMRNGGGHGGRSEEEINIPLFLFKEKCLKKSNITMQYNQIDIAPSLAMVFSVDIPTQSIGCLIPEFLDNFTLEEQLYAYFYNSYHLIEKYSEAFGSPEKNDYGPELLDWFKNAKEAHKTFLKLKRGNGGTSAYMFEKAKGNYIRVSKMISRKLSRIMMKFDHYLMGLGLILAMASAGYTLLNVCFEIRRTEADEVLFSKSQMLCLACALIINIVGHFFFSWFAERSILACVVLTLLLGISIYGCIQILTLSFKILLPLNSLRSFRLSITLPLPCLAVFLFHTLSLMSTSFIEEEHQTWYYLCPTMLLITFLNALWRSVRASTTHRKDVLVKILEQVSKMRLSIVMFLFLSLLRRLNQTGDKWSHLPDVEEFLNKEDHKTALTMFFILGLWNLTLTLKSWLQPLQMTAAILAAAFVYCFRGITGSVAFFSADKFNNMSVFMILMLFWICIGVIVTFPYKNLFSKHNYGYDPKPNILNILQTNLSCSLLITALLHKPHNVILIPALTFTLRVCYKLCDINHFYSKVKKDKSYNLVQKTMMTIFIANMFYFYQGNSNSLSTIDLTPGYIGLSSYNPFTVGFFITLHTYSAPINSFLFLVLYIFKNQMKYLPQKQEKEQHSNKMVVETTDKDLNNVITLYAAFSMLPVAVCLALLVVFRYHLFIYSVFAPKAFYVCYSLLVFYINFSLTKLYFALFKS